MFEVDDYVKIRDDISKYNGRTPGKLYVTSEMEGMHGLIARITEKTHDSFGSYESRYRIDLDHEKFWWSDDVLEAVYNNDELCVVTDDDITDMFGGE